MRFSLSGGERGIRTPGTSRYNGFQDRRIRPLCHFSAAKVEILSNLQTFTALFLKLFFWVKNIKYLRLLLIRYLEIVTSRKKIKMPR